MQIISDIELAFSLASALPAAISFIKAEVPAIETEVQADYEAIATPVKALVADVEIAIKGGVTQAFTAASLEKTTADFEALLGAATGIVPKIEADAAGEYAKILPVLQPLLTALGIQLPAFPVAAPSAA